MVVIESNNNSDYKSSSLGKAIKVKLCGLKRNQDVDAALKYGADFFGFVFYKKSLRNISLQTAQEICINFPKLTSKVAVVVDPDIEQLKKIRDNLKPQFFQIHGNTTIDDIKKIRECFSDIGIIKAFNIGSKSDLEKSLDFCEYVDFFLYDAIISGEGRPFEWSLLKNFSPKKEWFLSGGINFKNVFEAIKITNAKMIDVSSAIEIKKGEKSIKLIEEFMKLVHDKQN